MTRTITIPALANGVAGFVVEVVAAACVFHCISVSSAGAFTVRVDEGPEVPISAGKGFGSPTAKKFSRIGFYNSGNVALNVTYYAGVDPWTDPNGSRSNIVSVSSADMILFTNAPGLNPPYGVSSRLTIANNTFVDLLANYDISGFGDVHQRESFAVANTTTGRDLDVVTVTPITLNQYTNTLSSALDNTCVDLVRGDSDRVFGDKYRGEYFRLWNKSGVAINCAISLFLYRTNQT